MSSSHDCDLAPTSAVGATTNLHHLQLMKILEIDHELSDRGKKGLVWCYKKYKAFNAAVQLMEQLVKQGKWPLARKPNHTELVEIFMSKSYWHSHVAKPFGIIARYPQMVAWLECEDDDKPSDFEVWHQQKAEYGFKELKEWIGNKGTLDKAVKARLEKGKGKAKAKAMVVESDEGEEKEAEDMEVDVKEKVGKKQKASGSNVKKTHKRK